MATYESTDNEAKDTTSPNENDKTCCFCNIAKEQSGSDTEMQLFKPSVYHSQMRKDDELVCFRDLKPGARHHYLVVPRTHVGNCKSLRKEHIPLVEKMEEMGRSVLQKKKVTDLDDIRMGFHMPPFSSVPHLHLHVIAPASQMSIRSLRHYGPQSYWFITVDKVLQQLRTQNQVK
ncbi:histidine triad nucleotide-binding protein 3-like isoform X1 [Salvelinus namaycush]|uniref:Histidine triad nucleotide-binding protein 3-like isoform X1 n=1 Tax=Salvelinus namaycush TaxID=8040 RepID=A0A8U0P329_SALNM|nr:histidine triad nucleotide-binding protein 3-like isoform X1 [Salvelinus namaycush]